jgi:hypothetical protein
VQISSSSSSPDPLPETIQGYRTITVTKQGNTASDYFFHLGQEELKFADPKKEAAFRSQFLEQLPQFLYFEDLGLLKGEMPVAKLLGNDPVYATERNFLKLGGIADLSVLRSEPRRRDVAIHNAERQVTERLRKYWTQDPSRQFHIKVDKDTLRITLSDSTGVLDSPEERSLGSRWFMSFYINFAARVSGQAENAILLFDEPGIHVHPRGQRDLLPFIEELSAKRQIIYTTHLPFLINRNFPSRIRVIEKRGTEGTIVNNKPHENRWKAIRSSVGLLASDSFLIGDTCLIVEGVSDHVFVAGLSRFLAELGQPHLDMNEVAIIPALSATETVAPARFCQAEKIPIVVLLDSDNQGDQAEDLLLKDDFIRREQVLRINSALGSDDKRRRAFEDILDSEEYLAAVNSFYSRLLGPSFNKISRQEIRSETGESGEELPIASALSKLFGKRKYGGSDKRAVAEEFINTLPVLDSVERAKREQLGKRFEPVARLFLIVANSLEKLAAEA